MKIKIILFLFVSLRTIICSIDSAEAGIATIYGRVTEEDGVTAVALEEIQIRVLASNRYADRFADFPWDTKKLKTNIQGYYKAFIKFPDDVIQIVF